MRPDPDKRLFVSQTVDAFVSTMAAKIQDPDLATLFQNAYPNTLDTTALIHTTGASSAVAPQAASSASAPGNGAGLASLGCNDTFIVTGDIHAMWLRDSYNQVKPYIDLLGSLRNGVLALLQSDSAVDMHLARKIRQLEMFQWVKQPDSETANVRANQSPRDIHFDKWVAQSLA